MFAERSSFFVYSFEGGGVIYDGELGPSQLSQDDCTQIRPSLWLNATWRVKLRSCGLKSVVLTCLLLPSLAG